MSRRGPNARESCRRMPRMLGLATVSRESETEVIEIGAWVAAYVRVIARLESMCIPSQTDREAA
jgi:hypothetical protein